MLEYMKVVYKSRGENLLNKFRSGNSIRIALGQLDENDKNRAVILQAVQAKDTRYKDMFQYNAETVQLVGEPVWDYSGVSETMDDIEVVEPPTPKPSL